MPRTRQPSLRSRNSCRPRRSTRPRPSCLRRGGAIAGQPRSAGCDVPAPSPVQFNGPRASVPRPTEPRHGRGDVLGRATARRHDRSTYAPVLDHLSWSLSWRHDGVSAPPRRRAGGLDGRVGPDFRRRVRARPRRRAVCDDHGNEAALGVPAASAHRVRPGPHLRPMPRARGQFGRMRGHDPPCVRGAHQGQGGRGASAERHRRAGGRRATPRTARAPDSCDRGPSVWPDGEGVMALGLMVVSEVWVRMGAGAAASMGFWSSSSAVRRSCMPTTLI